MNRKIFVFNLLLTDIISELWSVTLSKELYHISEMFGDFVI